MQKSKTALLLIDLSWDCWVNGLISREDMLSNERQIWACLNAKEAKNLALALAAR